MMPRTVDLAVIGAGPAGMAATLRARSLGLSVAVLDEQPSPGGQIYRAVTQGSALPAAVLGPDYHSGRELAERFAACGAHYRPGALIWQVQNDTLDFTTAEGPDSVQAKRIVVASGAMERPFPVKGWTLPGVMTAGAAQIMLKTSATAIPDAVFAGSGPLLYLVVAQYARAGVPVALVLDTTPRGARLRAARHLPGALRATSYLAKGLGLLGEIRRAGIRVVTHVEDLSIEGEGAVTGLRWRTRDGEDTAAATQVFLHQGVIPNVNLAMALGCRQLWDESQRCWRPELDRWGRSSLPDVFIAGDAGGIAGAVSARLMGDIAAIAVAAELGALDVAAAERLAAPLFAASRRDKAVRPFIEELYRPAAQFRAPADDAVIICRCEEVSRGAIAAAVQEKCAGPNQLKSFTRCGMGACQGRMCGHSVGEVMSALTGRQPAELGYLRIRMPVKPVTLGDIAGERSRGSYAS